VQPDPDRLSVGAALAVIEVEVAFAGPVGFYHAVGAERLLERDSFAPGGDQGGDDFHKIVQRSGPGNVLRHELRIYVRLFAEAFRQVYAQRAERVEVGGDHLPQRFFISLFRGLMPGDVYADAERRGRRSRFVFHDGPDDAAALRLSVRRPCEPHVGRDLRFAGLDAALDGAQLGGLSLAQHGQQGFRHVVDDVREAELFHDPADVEDAALFDVVLPGRDAGVQSRQLETLGLPGQGLFDAFVFRDVLDVEDKGVMPAPFGVFAGDLVPDAAFFIEALAGYGAAAPQFIDDAVGAGGIPAVDGREAPFAEVVALQAADVPRLVVGVKDLAGLAVADKDREPQAVEQPAVDVGLHRRVREGGEDQGRAVPLSERTHLCVEPVKAAALMEDAVIDVDRFLLRQTLADQRPDTGRVVGHDQLHRVARRRGVETGAAHADERRDVGRCVQRFQHAAAHLVHGGKFMSDDFQSIQRFVRDLHALSTLLINWNFCCRPPAAPCSDRCGRSCALNNKQRCHENLTFDIISCKLTFPAAPALYFLPVSDESSANSSSGSKGLEMCPFMPSARHFSTSPEKASAVMAMMGTVFASGLSRPRISLVAS